MGVIVSSIFEDQTIVIMIMYTLCQSETNLMSPYHGDIRIRDFT
jgi:hypothetical protein